MPKSSSTVRELSVAHVRKSSDSVAMGKWYAAERRLSTTGGACPSTLRAVWQTSSLLGRRCRSLHLGDAFFSLTVCEEQNPAAFFSLTVCEEQKAAAFFQPDGV